MPTFPAVSKAPRYPLPVKRVDRTIKSPMEAGYVNTRSRYTKGRRIWGPVTYESLNDADNVLLEVFMDTVHECTDNFTWPHPISGEYDVRFQEPPSLEPTGYDGDGFLWRFQCSFIEV